jgi:hypothetical protein
MAGKINLMNTNQKVLAMTTAEIQAFLFRESLKIAVDNARAGLTLLMNRNLGTAVAIYEQTNAVQGKDK